MKCFHPDQIFLALINSDIHVFGKPVTSYLEPSSGHNCNATSAEELYFVFSANQQIFVC